MTIYMNLSNYCIFMNCLSSKCSVQTDISIEDSEDTQAFKHHKLIECRHGQILMSMGRTEAVWAEGKVGDDRRHALQKTLESVASIHVLGDC
jgi:hypothetical protein